MNFTVFVANTIKDLWSDRENRREKERERESISLRTLFDQDKIDSTLLLEGRANIEKRR